MGHRMPGYKWPLVGWPARCAAMGHGPATLAARHLSDGDLHDRQASLPSNPRWIADVRASAETMTTEARSVSSSTSALTAPWQELSDVAAALVGCGHVSGLFVRRIWPLALMLCADRVPIESTHFKGR